MRYMVARSAGPRSDRTAMPVYSHSRLETYENCPLKYRFRYIEKIEKVEQSIEAFLGNRVHETLKKLYDDLLVEKQNTLDELLEMYEAEWRKNWGSHVKIVRRDMTEQNYFDYGAKCIRNYYAQYQPFRQAQTLGTETHLTFPLDGDGNYKLQGYVDRVARRTDGTVEIHDYKTGRTLPGQQTADADRQLALYQIGVERHWRETRQVELVWHYVGFSTTLRSRRTREQLVQLSRKTIELIDRIERTTVFEGRMSALCDWCEYKPDCPLWRHTDAVAALAPAEFKADDGVRLADEYAEARATLDEAKLRVEELKEQILAFAQQHGVSLLQGSDAQVVVHTSESERFPGKQENKRAALEVLLKAAGKWDEISELDTTALLRAMEEGSWPAELNAQVRDFLLRSRITKIRLLRPDSAGGDEAE